MKRNRISTCIAVLSLLAVMITGCDDNMPAYPEIALVDVTLDADLRSGLTLEEGQKEDISLRVTLTPEDATDRAENYSSSNTDVATVSPYGIVTAINPGTSELTITVGGKSVSFTLTVTAIVRRPFDDIEIVISEKELVAGSTWDLAPMVVVSPLSGTNDVLEFTSSNENIVKVSDTGKLEAIANGRATITVYSKWNPSIKDELPVAVFSYYEYPGRSNWTMTTSHDIPLGGAENSSLTAALDGDENTNFLMVRPSKTYSGVTVPSGDAIYFTVDMKQSQEVSYFQIFHRNTNELFIRWHGFDQILGSDDGTTFTVIATNIRVTDVGESTILSPEIEFAPATYRYIRFYAKEASCFFESSYSSKGSTVQIKELYLGTKKYD